MLLTIGRAILGFLNEVGILIKLAGKVFWLTLTGRLHWKNFKEQVVSLGYNSVGIILTTAFFIGMVFAMQITKEFVKYGAGRVVGGVVSIAFWRELAPVFTAIIIAGRVGSAITAELGSMKVTEQIDAVTSFGIDKDYFLIAPRVMAMMFMMPVLVAFFDVIGIVGSYIMSVKIMGLNSVMFIKSVNELSKFKDLAGGLFKAMVFGLTLALIACRQGVMTEGGALGVGQATTRAVVLALLAVFVLNYFLSAVIF